MRQNGGDLWEGAVRRRDSLGFVGLEAVLFGLFAGLIASFEYELRTANAVGVGIVVFFVTIVVLQLPVIGFIFSIVVSFGWAGLAFYITYEVGTLFLAIVIGLLVLLLTLGLHLTFRE